MPIVPQDAEAAIHALHDLGARFLRCLADKVPIEPAGYYHRDRIPAGLAIRHLARDRDHHLAIEPRSLRCGVLDFDGDKSRPAEESLERADRYCQWMIDHLMGSDYLVGRYPSVSGYGCHLWAQIDVTRPAPLGRQPSSGKRYMCRNGLLVNPLDPASKFDLKCKHGYALCTHYLVDLGEAIRENLKPSGGAAEWSNVIAWCDRGSRRAAPVSPPDARADAVPAGEVRPLSEPELDKIRARLWATDHHPGHWNSGNERANKLGVYAGVNRLWWPSCYAEAEAQIRANAPREYLAHCLKRLAEGYKYGCTLRPANPATDWPDKRR